MKVGTCLFLSIVFLCISCDKENQDPHLNDPIEFVSLFAARDLIFTEDTTQLTATASGFQITYSWEVEKGELLGAGSTCVYVATPCSIGENEIFCTVTDGYGKQEKKSVVVTVL